MVGKQNINRRNHIFLFLFLGIISLLVVSLLSSVIITDKIDYLGFEVDSLRCTFVRTQFDAETTISKETGRNITVLNITIGTKVYQYYSQDISKPEIVDVGILRWEDGDLLAFSSYLLMEGKEYIVERGKIIYLNTYGVIENKPIVRLDEVRETNWFDSFIQKNLTVISILMSFLIVITVTLLSLPIFEYLINRTKSMEEWFGT